MTRSEDAGGEGRETGDAPAESAEEARAALAAALPEHPAARSSDAPVERLGGLTNRVFRVGTGTEGVVVRLPGAGTEAYIDREVEAINARTAARAGVSPEVLHADPASGILITRALEAVMTMSPAEFRARAGAVERAGHALATLHRSGETFAFRFEPFAMIEEYLALLSTRTVELPAGYHEVVRRAEPLRDALEASAGPLAPCHCDPLCENFLDTGERVWIVDWEYSGMNDPYWDIGDLAIEGGFDADQERRLLAAWCGAEPTPSETARVVVYKAVCDLLWTLWGLIQHADGNPAEDFMAYALGRFERCKALMDDTDFDVHVARLGEPRPARGG